MTVRRLVKAGGSALAGAVIVAVALLMVLPRATGGAALTVLSGSMEPTLPVGSLVLVSPVDPSSVRLGDVITYQYPTGSASLTTHRVVGHTSTPQGEPAFVTKGDANPGEDREPVPEHAVRGRVWFHVPMLGAFRDFVSTPGALAALLLVAIVVAAWDPLRRRVGTGTPIVGSTAAAATVDAGGAVSNVAMGRGAGAQAGTRDVAPQQLMVVRAEAADPEPVARLAALLGARLLAVGADELVLSITGTSDHLDRALTLLDDLATVTSGRSAVVHVPQSLDVSSSTNDDHLFMGNPDAPPTTTTALAGGVAQR